MVRIRYLVSAIVLTVILMILVLTSGCKEGDYSFDRFPAYDPALAFDQEDIDYLRDNFSLPESLRSRDPDKTELEVASAIKEWQHAHMKLVSSMEDLSYPMRWNQVMPGIHPARDLIRDRNVIDDEDNDTNKIYGVCWDFASIFTSIARYHGLDVMISAWRMYLSDQVGNEEQNLNSGADRGMSPQESTAMAGHLRSLGYDIPERVLQEAVFETYVHYRPEVWITDAWVSFDATYPSGDYLDDENYSEIAWDEFLDETLCTRL